MIWLLLFFAKVFLSNELNLEIDNSSIEEKSDIVDYLKEMEDYGTLIYYKYHSKLPGGSISKEVTDILDNKMEGNFRCLYPSFSSNDDCIDDKKEEENISNDEKEYFSSKFYNFCEEYVQKHLDIMHERLFSKSLKMVDAVIEISDIKRKDLVFIASSKLGFNKLKRIILENEMIGNGRFEVNTGDVDGASEYYKSFMKFYLAFSKFVDIGYKENPWIVRREIIQEMDRLYGSNNSELLVPPFIYNAFKHSLLDTRPGCIYSMADFLLEEFKVVNGSNLKYFLHEGTIDFVDQWYFGSDEDPFEEFHQWTPDLISLVLRKNCLNILFKIPKKYLKEYLKFSKDDCDDVIVLDGLSYDGIERKDGKNFELLDIVNREDLESLKSFLSANPKYNESERILSWIALRKEWRILEVFVEMSTVTFLDKRIILNLERIRGNNLRKVLEGRGIEINLFLGQKWKS